MVTHLLRRVLELALIRSKIRPIFEIPGSGASLALSYPLCQPRMVAGAVNHPAQRKPPLILLLTRP